MRVRNTPLIPAHGAVSSRQRGQALVEAALVIPLLVVLAFGVVLVGRVVHATVAVQATAREAGRALAAAPSEPAGLAAGRERGQAVAAGHGLEADRLAIALDSGGFARGGLATVRVRYRVPVAGLLLFDRVEMTVSSVHREQIEPYRSREVGDR